MSRKAILGFSITILSGFNALLFALYIRNMDFLNDIVWVLPILTISSIITLFALEEYNKEKTQ